MDPVNAPDSTWLYDRGAQSLSKIYVSRPEMEGAPLVPMQPLEIKVARRADAGFLSACGV
jgi:hypothetical protein